MEITVRAPEEVMDVSRWYEQLTPAKLATYQRDVEAD